MVKEGNQAEERAWVLFNRLRSTSQVSATSCRCLCILAVFLLNNALFVDTALHHPTTYLRAVCVDERYVGVGGSVSLQVNVIHYNVMLNTCKTTSQAVQLVKQARDSGIAPRYAT